MDLAPCSHTNRTILELALTFYFVMPFFSFIEAMASRTPSPFRKISTIAIITVFVLMAWQVTFFAVFLLAFVTFRLFFTEIHISITTFLRAQSFLLVTAHNLLPQSDLFRPVFEFLWQRFESIMVY
jgi:hypothetical protein